MVVEGNSEFMSDSTKHRSWASWLLFSQTAALEVEQGGEMKPAGMGRGDGVWHGQQSRGDSILWITEGIRGKGDLPEVCSLYSSFRNGKGKCGTPLGGNDDCPRKPVLGDTAKVSTL